MTLSTQVISEVPPPSAARSVCGVIGAYDMLCNIRERDRNYAACISYWHCTLVRHGKITGLCKALEHLFCNSLRQKVTVSFLNYVFQGHVENLKKKYQVLLSFKEAGTLADRHSQSCGFSYQSLSHANMKKKMSGLSCKFYSCL